MTVMPAQPMTRVQTEYVRVCRQTVMMEISVQMIPVTHQKDAYIRKTETPPAHPGTKDIRFTNQSQYDNVLWTYSVLKVSPPCIPGLNHWNILVQLSFSSPMV